MKTNDIDKKAQKLKVTPEVYMFLRKSNRKMRYFTRDLKKDQIIIESEKVIIIPSREDSYERLREEGVELASEEKSVEDIVVESLMKAQLHLALNALEPKERRLIQEIFFSKGGDGKSEREAAKSLGIPQKTLNDQKLRILFKLRELLE